MVELNRVEKRLITFLGIFFALVSKLYALDPPLSKQLYAIRFDQSRGLPVTSIFDLAQDPQGFIYLATAKGVYRYDGFSFQSLNGNADQYMGGSRLTVLSDNTLFFESFDGYVYRFDHIERTWDLFNVNKPVHFLNYGIHKDSLFVVQTEGIDIYNITNRQYIKTISFPIGIPEHALNIGADYFLVNEESLLKVNSGGLQKSFYFKELSSSKTIRYIYTHQDKIYVLARSAYQEGVWVFDRNLNYLYTFPVDELNGVVQHIDFVDDCAWISTSKGVFIYQKLNDKWQFKERLFEDKSISRVLKGKNNEYWISVIGEGLFLVVDPYQYVYSIPNETITKIVKDISGYIVGTTKGNIYQLTADFSARRLITKDPMGGNINYLYHNAQVQDLFFVPVLGFYHQHSLSQFYDLALKSVVDLDHKYYALATSSHLILYPKSHLDLPVKSSVWDTVYEQKRGTAGFSFLLKGVRSKTVCYDQHNNRLYVLTNVGVFEIDSKGNSKELLIDNKPISVDQIAYANEKLYMLTYDGNLRVYSNGILEKIDIGPTILDFKLYHSHLVLKTNDGFVIYDTQKDTTKNVIFKFEPAAVRDYLLTYNKLVLVLATGLVEVPIVNDGQKISQLTFFIESLKTGDHVYYGKNLVKKLPYDQNSLEINYAILDYTYGAGYALYYRVNNGKWEKLTANTRSLQFHRLSSGDYLVEFRLDDQMLDQRVTFHVAYPYWQTWWFYLFSLIGVTVILTVYFTTRRKKLQKEIRFLEEKVDLEKKLGKSLLTSIKAQMNPHFYFNALNSIQAFIYKNDKTKAIQYLSKFSKLTRNILAQTDRDYITLEEEIATLSLYLDLEKMRFGDRFSYIMECPSEIDQKSICFPAMLLQPYVENAVKHGFTKATRDGLIQIRFKVQDYCLHVMVEDNGAGYNRFVKIGREDEHKPFAVEANKKRLEILNASAGSDFSVVYDDVWVDEAVGGTRVRIRIPISYLK